jgi:Holliday junction resolvase
LRNWLELWRDRVVVRSLASKRRLDAVFARRQLDRKLWELGGQVLRLAGEGRVAVPRELSELLAECRTLEEKLAAEQQAIAALESEAV